MPEAWVVLIPARAASTRLPGKPLLDLGGLPMVVRVAHQGQASGAAQCVVATDDDAIAAAVEAHGIDAVRTGAHHATGTDRLAEAVDILGLPDDCIVVNLQGDEPLVPPLLLHAVATTLADHPDTVMATVATPVQDAAQYLDPNVVKVVCDARGRALYFSRAPIPWQRDADPDDAPHSHALRHIGLYAYRAGFLRRYPGLASGRLERREALEQLRILEHGHAIQVLVIDTPPPAGIDTPADLERVRALLAAG